MFRDPRDFKTHRFDPSQQLNGQIDIS